MSDYLRKYKKYKQKYLDAKKSMNGGSIFFAPNNGFFNIVKKSTTNGNLSLTKIDKPPTTFDLDDRVIIETFMNAVLPCFTINGVQLSHDVSDTSKYLSSGSFGATVVIDDYILKIIHMDEPDINVKEIHNMLKTVRYPDIACQLYSVITYNRDLMNLIANRNQFSSYKSFHIYCPNNSSIDISSLIQNLDNVVEPHTNRHRLPDPNRDSDLCFLIMEKGQYDVDHFYKTVENMTMDEIISYTDIHSLHINNATIQLNVSLSADVMKLLYASKMMDDMLNAIFTLNEFLNLLHCDIKMDNIMIMPNATNTLPQFKLIDFGSTQVIVNHKNKYNPVYINGIDIYEGLGLYATHMRPDGYNQTYYTILYDYYKLFDTVINFLNMGTIDNDSVLLYDITGVIPETPLKTIDKNTLYNVIMNNYDFFMPLSPNPQISCKISSLFNIIIILSQIPYLLRGDVNGYDFIYFKKENRDILLNQYKSIYPVNLASTIPNFVNFLRDIAHDVI
jgi:hypothetical protein